MHRLTALETFITFVVHVSGAAQPNIVFILADDLGWNDVSFHGYNEIPTPNIDRLASEGVILNGHYGQYLCTPSRTALMTGKYPIRLGLQHSVFTVGEPRSLSLAEKLLPQYLKELGYGTHMVGKWHLGYNTWNATPTFRGFDSFFGYYTGMIDYFTHASEPLPVSAELPQDTSPYWASKESLSVHQVGPAEWYSPYPGDTQGGHELLDNLEPAYNYSGRYLTDIFTERTEALLSVYDFKQPLFLYLSHTAPHYAPGNDLVQTTEAYASRFPHIAHEGRRKYAGTIAALDDSVGRLREALAKRSVLDNTVIIFASDNGGTGHERLEQEGKTPTYGNNWPLRGTKSTQWEAGVRTAAFVWGKGITNPGRASTEMYHMSDWLPTLVALAGGMVPVNIDGHNIWPSISENSPSPREELLIQANSVAKEYTMRWRHFKLMSGAASRYGKPPAVGWYEPVTGLNSSYVTDAPSKISCGTLNPLLRPCDPNDAPCLFDVVNDPCERNNLALALPDITDFLWSKILIYNASALPSGNVPFDPNARPELHNGFTRPWMK